jgi:hypothetical protein
VGGFPFYVVSATYSALEHHFIVAADYRGDTAELSVYPFKNDMSRLAVSTLLLSDVLPRKAIATVHVNSLIFKPSSASVTVTQAEFILGYRSGQLVVVEYKDRECRIRQRLNRALKGEGFFSRASSAIFGGEDSYSPYFKSPVRSFTVNPFTPDFYHSWQVGNNILLQRELSEEKEGRFFGKLDSMDLENYHLNYDINKVVREGEFYSYGCDHYTALCHPESKTYLLAFREEINCFASLPARKELAVSLASREEVLILDYSYFVLKGRICLQIPLRNLTAFTRKGQEFLLLMPYENYLLAYNLSNDRYCKLRGHKSYIAAAAYHEGDDRIVTAGMDHRICFMKVANISESSWVAAVKEESMIKIREFDISEQKFDDIYHIGEYNNNRNNLSSYGYANLF